MANNDDVSKQQYDGTRFDDLGDNMADHGADALSHFAKNMGGARRVRASSKFTEKSEFGNTTPQDVVSTFQLNEYKADQLFNPQAVGTFQELIDTISALGTIPGNTAAVERFNIELATAKVALKNLIHKDGEMSKLMIRQPSQKGREHLDEMVLNPIKDALSHLQGSFTVAKQALSANPLDSDKIDLLNQVESQFDQMVKPFIETVRTTAEAAEVRLLKQGAGNPNFALPPAEERTALGVKLEGLNAKINEQMKALPGPNYERAIRGRA